MTTLKLTVWTIMVFVSISKFFILKLKKITKTGFTPLYTAFCGNNFKNNYLNVLKYDVSNQHILSQKCLKEILNSLLDKKANPNIVFKDGRTIYHFICTFYLFSSLFLFFLRLQIRNIVSLYPSIG